MTNRVLAALLAILISVTAFAQPEIEPQARFATGGPSTTDNDDTCDVGVFPAATLLLPYFEVDLRGGGATTLFTVTNTTHLPQVARVTIWTDYAFPVMHFHLFLTGYDVQSVNLHDVIANGIIAPPGGTGSAVSHVGSLSSTNNPVLDEASCSALPGAIPAPLLARVRAALTTGNVPGGCGAAGSNHPNQAIGYATIDVAGNCGDAIPADPSYFTSEIRFDNVLIGDYQQLDASRQLARGNELVHIRAIPEGGTPSTRLGAAFANNFPRSFYSRYVTTRESRQPLPSLWAARWISDRERGVSTRFNIWREANTSGATICSAFATLGGQIPVTEIVLFDEDENPETAARHPGFPAIGINPLFRATSSVDVDDTDFFPPNTTGAVGGWMYLNLDNANATGNPPASQSWVTVSMTAGQLSVEFDAAALGNGCTPETDRSRATGGVRPIGPAPNRNDN